MQMNKLTRANEVGTQLLAPAGDLIIGAGAYHCPSNRVANTPFSLYLMDMHSLVNVPTSMRTRMQLVGRLVAEWYSRAMWPTELRSTSLDPVDAQLDLHARGQYSRSAERAEAIANRFDVLLQRLDSVRNLIDPLQGAEAYNLVEHIISKLLGPQDPPSIDPFIEVEAIVKDWLPTVQTHNELKSARERATWLINQVAAMKAAPKLLPSDSSSQSGGKVSSALLSKVQAGTLVSVVKSNAFLQLVADITPRLTTLIAGQANPLSNQTVYDVLKRCFKSDDNTTPITAVVQWLVSDTPALPYHPIFTQLVWVRQNKAAYAGRGVASDEQWNQLPMCEGFLLLDKVVSKMDDGQYQDINFFDDIYLALKSYMNSEPEQAVGMHQQWHNTDSMRKMLPCVSKVFEMWGYGSASKANSIASVITNAISFIDNAPSGLCEVHVEKVAAATPLLLKAVGETWRGTVRGMPDMPFVQSFVNPTLHSAHLQTLAIDQAAAQQVSMLNKVYPGFLSQIAASAAHKPQ
jgi:hypothetical protein